MPKIRGFDYGPRFERANIPVKHRGKGLDDFVPTGPAPGHHTGRSALKAAREFVDHFRDYYVSSERSIDSYPEDRSKIGRGLMFSGLNGTRKTTLSAAIATEILWKADIRVFMIRFSDYKDALTTTFESTDSERKERAKAVVQRARSCSLLVLDDIGQEHVTKSGFTEKELHELIRIRHSNGRPTVVTTNVEEEDMLGKYGQSWDSFRKEAFTTHIMLGPDSRKHKF